MIDSVSTMSANGRHKMYILIRDDVPLGLAIVAAAHASLAGYLRFEDREATSIWLRGPFRKVICRVSPADFEAAKRLDDHVVLTESALANQEVAIAFCPRENWPATFKAFELYR